MKFVSQFSKAMTFSLVLFAVSLADQAIAANNNHSKNNSTLIAAKARVRTLANPWGPLVKVPYRSWLPRKEKPRMVLFCVHALGFSSKSYDNFGRRMAASGIPTYAIDVRGFGQWIQKPEEAHMDFEACLTDVEQGLKTLHKAYPKLPVFLVGESMGGAIAIQAASRYPDLVNGLVSAVPSSSDRKNGKSTSTVAYRTSGRPLGDVDMAPIIVDGATANVALRKKIEAEPLNRMDLSKKEIAQFEKFMEQTHDAAPLIERIPTLMLVAYKDRLVTASGSVELFTEMTAAEKLMIGDGNSEHLMLEEAQMTPEIEWILKGWLREKAGKAVLRHVATK
ncbi:MAG: alpha/beta fold hydrolase [Candidatus Melainabacteria bacterium]|nr:alpha/beta fold hydrolase [Candidatus Melainabacteria bacterium]